MVCLRSGERLARKNQDRWRRAPAMRQIKAEGSNRAYQAAHTATRRHPAMPLVAFPRRPQRALPDAPQRSRVSAQVIPFPRPSVSLTQRDVSALLGLMSGFGGEWLCEARRDSKGGLSALIVPRDAPPEDNTAYLVRRDGPRLVLSDAQLSPRQGTLGIYEDAGELAAALGRRSGWQPWR